MKAFFRNIIAHLFYRQYLPHKPSKAEIESSEYSDIRRTYFNRGVNVARKYATVSSALFQRELKVPYSVSSRLLDLLEYDGVIAPTQSLGVYKYNPVHRPKRLVNLGL
jgi:hypothetical protein